MENKILNYARKILLNEMCIGQEWDSIYKRAISTDNWPFSVDFSDYRIAITGLMRSFYRSFGITGITVTSIYQRFQKIAEAVIKECNCEGELFLFIYGRKNQIVLLFSPGSSKKSLYIISKITNKLQRLYRDEFLPIDAQMNNFTVYSEKLDSYEQLAPAFAQLLEMHELSFFNTGYDMMDASVVREIKKPLRFVDAMETIDEIESHMLRGNDEEAIALARQLFSKQLRFSLDKKLCEETVMQLKRKLLYQAEIYQLSNIGFIENVLDVGRYFILDTLCETVCDSIKQIALEIKQHGAYYSSLTQNAMLFMRRHYMEGIDSSDVARHVCVVPQHLSRVFNREAGCSIPTYLNTLRMEAAKKLLAETDFKIQKIAEDVGVNSTSRFYALFRQYTGITATEYRRAHH